MGSRFRGNDERCSLIRRRIESARAAEAGAPVRVVDTLDAHALTAPRRVHEVAVAEIDADVRERSVARVVEHEVAGLQLGALYRAAQMALRGRAARQLDAPGALIDMGHEAAAIEAGLGRAAAVVISRSDGEERLPGR